MIIGLLGFQWHRPAHSGRAACAASDQALFGSETVPASPKGGRVGRTVELARSPRSGINLVQFWTTEYGMKQQCARSW